MRGTAGRADCRAGEVPLVGPPGSGEAQGAVTGHRNTSFSILPSGEQQILGKDTGKMNTTRKIVKFSQLACSALISVGKERN